MDPATLLLTVAANSSSNRSIIDYLPNSTAEVSYDLIESTPTPDPLVPPIEFLEVNERSLHNIIAYSVLFLFAATGNLTVFISILTNNYNKIFKGSVLGLNSKSQITQTAVHHAYITGTPTRTLGGGLKARGKRYSKITLLILNLSLADLIVTFFLMPMEIFWRTSVRWIGGNILCKTCQFGRAFGLYLSSMIIICISLDRYLAIMYPLKQIDAQRRIKRMLIVAWIAAALCSAPQSFIFSVKSHPVYTTFEQCVSIGFFSSQEQEIMYNVFSLSAMYFVPIGVILFTYSMVIWKLVRKTKEHQRISASVSNSLRDPNCSVYAIQPSNTPSPVADRNKKQNLTLRTSDNGLTTYSRAKTRTLKLTLVIVITFLLCAVPYIFITLWYMFDRESAQQVDGRLQDFFFMMVVANSCMNPLIYGSFGNGNLFWWCNVCPRTKSDSGPGTGVRKVSASSAVVIPVQQGQQQQSSDWQERRRQEQLHPTLSTTLSSAPMIAGGARRMHQQPSSTYAHPHYAKRKLTVFTLFVRKMFACQNLTNHYFHDNIVNHHHSTLVVRVGGDEETGAPPAQRRPEVPLF